MDSLSVKQASEIVRDQSVTSDPFRDDISTVDSSALLATDEKWCRRPESNRHGVAPNGF